MKMIMRIPNVGKQSRHYGLNVAIRNNIFRSSFVSTCFAANIEKSNDDLLITCRELDKTFGIEPRTQL